MSQDDDNLFDGGDERRDRIAALRAEQRREAESILQMVRRLLTPADIQAAENAKHIEGSLDRENALLAIALANPNIKAELDARGDMPGIQDATMMAVQRVVNDVVHELAQEDGFSTFERITRGFVKKTDVRLLKGPDDESEPSDTF